MGFPKNPRTGSNFKADPAALVIVGLDTDDDATHPLYDERIHTIMPYVGATDGDGSGLVDDEGAPVMVPSPLTAAIHRYGCQQAVSLTAEQVDGEWVYYVIDGRSRVRSVRYLNDADGLKREIPCVVTELRGVTGSADQMRDLSIVLNAARTDDDVVTTAEKIARLHGQGVSKEDMAIMFAMSVGTLNRFLRFITGSATTAAAGDQLKAAVRSGAIGWSHAWKLLGKQPDGGRLPDDEIEAIAAKAIKDGGFTETRGSGASNGATNTGKKGRNGGESAGYLKHSTLRTWVARAPMAMGELPAEIRTVIDWMLNPAGVDLADDHPLAVLMVNAEKESAKKKKPGRNADPAKKAARDAKKQAAADKKAAAAKKKAETAAKKKAAAAKKKADAAAAGKPIEVATVATPEAEATTGADEDVMALLGEADDEPDPFAAAMAAEFGGGDDEDEDEDDEFNFDGDDEDE